MLEIGSTIANSTLLLSFIVSFFFFITFLNVCWFLFLSSTSRKTAFVSNIVCGSKLPLFSVYFFFLIFFIFSYPNTSVVSDALRTKTNQKI